MEPERGGVAGRGQRGDRHPGRHGHNCWWSPRGHACFQVSGAAGPRRALLIGPRSVLTAAKRRQQTEPGVTGLWSRAAPATHHALSAHQHSDPYGEYLEWVSATATLRDLPDGPSTGLPRPCGADTRQGQAAGWAGSSAGTPTTRFTRAAARARPKTKATHSRVHSGGTCSPSRQG